MSERVSLHLILLILFIAATSCKEDIKTQGSNISFYVDSVKIIDIPDSFGSTFIFSPIATQDIIWILGSNTGGELNLKSGTSKSLNEVFGFKYNGGISGSSNWHDSITGDIYMDVAFEKLIRYDANEKSFHRVNISEVSGVVGTKDKVYISTSKGLFAFEREKESLKYLYTNLNRNDIESISKVNDVLILIQTLSEIKYHYNVNTKRLMVIETCEKIPAKNVHETHPVFQILPKEIYNNRVIQDDSLTWIYVHDKLLFTFDNLNIYEYPALPKSKILQIECDKDYSYILFKNKFVIYRKSFLTRHKSLYYVGDLNNTRPKLEFIKSQLYATQDLDTFFHYMNVLESETTFKKYEDIDQLIERYKYRLLEFQFNPSIRNTTESYIKNQTFPQKYLQKALDGLISYYVQNENFDKTKKYVQLYHDSFPSDRNNNNTYTYPCYLTVLKSLDSLVKIVIPPDEKLYQTALLKEKLINCGGFGESYTDLTIVVDSYKKLLKQYPKSEFADDAAFYLTLNSSFSGDEGLEYSEESIKELRQFIKKYPNSDNVVDAEILIIEIYMAFYGTSDEMVAMFKKTSEEINKLEKKYKLNTSQRENLNNEKINLAHYTIQNTYQFIVEPNKPEYRLGEEIIMDVKLKNKLSKKVELQIFKNISPFNIHVTSEGRENFINSSKKDDQKTTIILSGNETKSWKINLNEETRSVTNPYTIGRYDFSKPGKYYFSFSGIHEYLNSNQSQFIIK